jgi:hypothetical protein
MYNNHQKREVELNKKDWVIIHLLNICLLALLFALLPGEEDLKKNDPEGYEFVKKFEEKRDAVLKGAVNAVIGKE